MKLRLSILLLAAALAAAPAAGQTIKSLGYNTTNGVVPTSLSTNTLRFTNDEGLQFNKLTTPSMLLGTNGVMTFYGTNSGFGFSAGATAAQFRDDLGLGATWLTNTDATNFRTAIGLGATNNVTFSNITASGTLAATGNVTLSGVNNTATAQTADSASSLMTRSLSDVRYLGEMWHAWRMSAYNTTNIPVSVFKLAPCVLYTNGQSAFYVEAFLDPSKYAGKTVRVLAYCRVDTTNGGNVQGVGRISYLTNTAGGADPNFPLTIGGQVHGLVGVFTNANTDVFSVATSTNQYLVFTSNVGTISNNATLIIASFGFNRASTNTTFTNGNLYMQAVQLVVEP